MAYFDTRLCAFSCVKIAKYGKVNRNRGPLKELPIARSKASTLEQMYMLPILFKSL
jgi:hypothetical protein